MFNSPRIFRIEFEPANGTYLAGQVVRGRVYIVSDTNIRHITGIKVCFHGASKVRWSEEVTEGRNDEQRTVTKNFDSGEIYFDSHQYVMGDGREVSLSPGEFSYPFSFLLPTTIPSSFEHDIGRVWYKVKAKISRSNIHKSFECKAHFSVTSILDLNHEPRLMEPCSRTNHKHFGFFCCKSGPLSAVVHLNKTGFVPGESIMVSAEIDNTSDRQIKGSSAKIIQRLTFRAENESKVETKILAEASRGPIQPGGEDRWSDVRILVPQVPPSKLIYCTIMEIEYYLEFRVKASGMAFDLVLDLPLTIGTIPMASAYNPFQTPDASAPPAPWMPDYGSNKQAAAPPSYADIFRNVAPRPAGYKPMDNYNYPVKSDQ